MCWESCKTPLCVFITTMLCVLPRHRLLQYFIEPRLELSCVPGIHVFKVAILQQYNIETEVLTYLHTAAGLSKFSRDGMPIGERSMHAIVQPQNLPQHSFCDSCTNPLLDILAPVNNKSLNVSITSCLAPPHPQTASTSSVKQQTANRSTEFGMNTSVCIARRCPAPWRCAAALTWRSHCGLSGT